MDHQAYLGFVVQLANIQLQLVNIDIAIARLLLLQRRRARRRVWVRPWLYRRPAIGYHERLLVELREEDPRSYKQFIRIPSELYDEIVARLTPRIQRKDTRFRKALPAALKVALTLRHLADGDTPFALQCGFRVATNTIAKIIREVTTVFIEEYCDIYINCPNTEEEWKEKARGFEEEGKVPHAIAAMDGKHVRIECPNKSGSTYYNYKGFFSIVLFALVDSDYKFLWVDVGCPGSMSDAQIFNFSQLKQCIEDGSLHIPPPEPLPGQDTPMPYFILGDDAFALSTWLMKPYSRRNLTHDNRIYNYRISKGRIIVENTFGVLANRFRVLRLAMPQHVDTCRNIVLTCCILHNMLRIRYPQKDKKQFDYEDEEGNLHPGEWRAGGEMPANDEHHPDRGSVAARNQRELLEQYFNSPEGRIPGQEQKI